MPDKAPDNVVDRRSAAIAKVDDYLASIPGAGRLPPRFTERYHILSYHLGWCLGVKFSDGIRRELHILVGDDFPYTPPQIVVADGPSVLTWPHLEAGGFLCILSNNAAVSHENPSDVVAYVLCEACRLVEESITGSNIEDFRREFLSYWVLAADKRAVNFISLLEPQGPGRRISVWRGTRRRIVGQSPETLKRWLRRWGSHKGKERDYKIHDGVLIWLPEPLLPAEYPHTAAEVRALARERSPEAAESFDELMVSGVKEIDIVLGAETPNGVCFAAMVVRPPGYFDKSKRKSDPLIKGFRPGCVPRRLLIQRFLSGGAKLTKATVERADHLWIHGRDQDPRQAHLRQARVAILGCGSLGGPLARLLAQAGVGNLLLVDPDIMDWPNVGRHELGASSVGRFKVPELVREIEKSYPHLGEISWRRERIGPTVQNLIEELASYNLIVSTMGNWAAEGFLNDFQHETDEYPPILYGWVEPNAVAAHAVLVPPRGACLRCGTNDKGHPHLRVTDWPEGGDDLQMPACGAVFTPYGPTELCWAHALLSETVIDALTCEPKAARHRIWIGPCSRVEAAGGTWTTKWVAEMGNPGNGGITMERAWLASASCPVCARRVRAA